MAHAQARGGGIMEQAFGFLGEGLVEKGVE
jgi:hypothetical protein